MEMRYILYELVMIMFFLLVELCYEFLSIRLITEWEKKSNDGNIIFIYFLILLFNTYK